MRKIIYISAFLLMLHGCMTEKKVIALIEKNKQFKFEVYAPSTFVPHYPTLGGLVAISYDTVKYINDSAVHGRWIPAGDSLKRIHQ